ncbi:hypothetical protein BRD17_09860, partial [Halobacteriales archaeon SW_7_68_16]
DEPVTFDAADSQSYNGSLTYEWDLDPAIGDGFDVDRTASDPDTTVSEAYTGIGEKEVEVRVTDEGGLTDRRRIRFAVTKFDANVTTTEATVDANSTVEIDYPVDRGYIANVSVDFGDGESTVVEYGDNNLAGKPITVSHNYSSTGDYDIVAVLNTTYGYTEDTSQTLTATEPDGSREGPTGGLVAHWTFDRLAGSDTAVDTVSGNNASLRNGAGFRGEGFVGSNALVCDGQDDYATVSDAYALEEGSHAVTFWARPDTLDGTQQVWSRRNPEVEFQYNGKTPTSYVPDTSVSGPSGSSVPDRWRFYVTTLYSNGTAHLYRDGSLVGRQTTATDTGTSPYNFCRDPSNKDEHYDGVLDDLRFYDRSFDGNDVDALLTKTARPVADAGADRAAEPNTSVSFDGSGSTDAAEDITSYDWSFGDGTTATGATVSHTYDSEGDYTVDLTVTDSEGHTDSDSILVDVTDDPGQTAGTAASSCFDIQQARDSPSNGTYWLDPAGNSGDPYEAHCTFPGRTGQNVASAYSFLYVQNGQRTDEVSDSNTCTERGLVLFAPRSPTEYDIGRDYVDTAYSDAFPDGIGKYYSGDRSDLGGLGPLGIYTTDSRWDDDSTNLPLNSDGMGSDGWVSTAGDAWWGSDRTDVTEPNGDYDDTHWLGIEYGDSGDIRWYNDARDQYAYTSYLCIHSEYRN